ncbi:MAG: type II toxin-antitoxin system RelE/ParE family toxin [Bryobacterales bacterium]|nr:type II toxin-antitoxin system RelE/ParE family toxin [Bryobacterales bacterium]
MRFAHKGLQRLAEQDDARLMPQHLIRRIRRILTELAAAQSARDMELPGYRLHSLKGNRRGQWSMQVSGNWRLVFRFVDGEAVDVDLIDYH